MELVGYRSDLGVYIGVMTFEPPLRSLNKLKIPQLYMIRKGINNHRKLFFDVLMWFTLYLSSNFSLTFSDYNISLGCQIYKTHASWDILTSHQIGYSIFKYANDHAFVTC